MAHVPHDREPYSGIRILSSILVRATGLRPHGAEYSQTRHLTQISEKSNRLRIPCWHVPSVLKEVSYAGSIVPSGQLNGPGLRSSGAIFSVTEKENVGGCLGGAMGWISEPKSSKVTLKRVRIVKRRVMLFALPHAHGNGCQVIEKDYLATLSAR